MVAFFTIKKSGAVNIVMIPCTCSLFVGLVNCSLLLFNVRLSAGACLIIKTTTYEYLTFLKVRNIVMYSGPKIDTL